MLRKVILFPLRVLVILLALPLGLLLIGLGYEVQRRQRDTVEPEPEAQVAADPLFENEDERRRWMQDLTPLGRVGRVNTWFDQQKTDVQPLVPIDIWAAQRKMRRLSEAN